jgi:hypothetical protein
MTESKSFRGSEAFVISIGPRPAKKSSNRLVCWMLRCPSHSWIAWVSCLSLASSQAAREQGDLSTDSFAY